MSFHIIILPSALNDIQQAIDYFDDQQAGLGAKFDNEINKFIITLKKNPFYQIRYATIRCIPLKKFPFMIHFSVDEEMNTVYIRAIIHTSLNPTNNWL